MAYIYDDTGLTYNDAAVTYDGATVAPPSGTAPGSWSFAGTAAGGAGWLNGGAPKGGRPAMLGLGLERRANRPAEA